MKLRVWHIPNVPGPPFRQIVASVDEARVVLKTLARYDLYLGDTMVSTNAQGLEVFEEGEWHEWSDSEGNAIDSGADWEPVEEHREMHPAVLLFHAEVRAAIRTVVERCEASPHKPYTYEVDMELIRNLAAFAWG